MSNVQPTVVIRSIAVKRQYSDDKKIIYRHWFAVSAVEGSESREVRTELLNGKGEAIAAAFLPLRNLTQTGGVTYKETDYPTFLDPDNKNNHIVYRYYVDWPERAVYFQYRTTTLVKQSDYFMDRIIDETDNLVPYEDAIGKK